MSDQPLINMIDHHCHMFQTYSKDESAILTLEHAFDLGLFAIIDAGDVTKSQYDRLAFLAPFERAFMVVGQHPLDIGRPFDFEQMVSVLNEPKVIGIGEIGLDFSRSDEDKQKQIAAFEAQLTLADQYDLPVVLHIRDAFEEAYTIVRRSGIPRIALHCFTGDANEAQRWLDLGAYLSFSGVITFKNAQDIQDALIATPLDKILLETDSPYLSPAPYRGAVNHPIKMPYIYEKAAELKKIEVDALAKQVKSNFIELYRLQYLV